MPQKLLVSNVSDSLMIVPLSAITTGSSGKLIFRRRKQEPWPSLILVIVSLLSLSPNFGKEKWILFTLIRIEIWALDKLISYYLNSSVENSTKSMDVTLDLTSDADLECSTPSRRWESCFHPTKRLTLIAIHWWKMRTSTNILAELIWKS